MDMYTFVYIYVYIYIQRRAWVVRKVLSTTSRLTQMQ